MVKDRRHGNRVFAGKEEQEERSPLHSLAVSEFADPANLTYSSLFIPETGIAIEEAKLRRHLRRRRSVLDGESTGW